MAAPCDMRCQRFSTPVRLSQSKDAEGLRAPGSDSHFVWSTMLRWRTFREAKLTRLKTSSLNVRIRQRETDVRLIQSQLETEMPVQAANLAPEVRFD